MRKIQADCPHCGFLAVDGYFEEVVREEEIVVGGYVYNKISYLEAPAFCDSCYREFSESLSPVGIKIYTEYDTLFGLDL